MDIHDLVPAHIFDITPYQPPKPVEELQREFGLTDCVRLGTNENPLGPSPKAVAAMQAAILQANRYPDGGSYYLKQALASKYDVAPDQILVGNGSDEVGALVMRTVLTPADDVVLSQYSFLMYQLGVKAVGANIIFVPPQADFRHDLDAMAQAITPATKLIFVDNPNNPTGTIVTQEEFDRFMAAVPEQVLVIVDEAYDDYVSAENFPDTMAYLKAGRRIVISKTFAKAHGLSGLRLGHAFTFPELADAVNRIRQPFNVNAIAQAAGVAALGDDAHLAQSRRINEAGKAYLYQAFEELGLSYLPTQGNFIAVDTGQDAKDLCQALLREGIIILPLTAYGLPRHVRITIGAEAENHRCIKALKQML